MTKLEDIRSRGEGGVRGKSATVESRFSHKKWATGGQGSEKGWDGDTLQGIVRTCEGRGSTLGSY